MDHQGGKDPTPQGRTPKMAPRRGMQTPPGGPVSRQYEDSRPGPSEQEDGTYFFGFKREVRPVDVTPE